jgi:hypothetical protein
MSERRPTPGPLLGFLTVEETGKKDGFIAALMVTDEKGYPLEFRATTPVRPTLVQRTLYGKQLDHYVGIELCGKTLVQQAGRKPKVILVPQRRLLELADEVDPDVVAIRLAGDKLQLDKDDSNSMRGTIQPPGLQPLVYEAHFASSDEGREVVALLEGCAGKFSLMEAFDRMRAALQVLAKEDPRYA